jgi:hypothetical protein
MAHHTPNDVPLRHLQPCPLIALLSLLSMATACSLR